MYKLPYYSSLNSQMAEYYKQVKMQEYNDTYQQAQLDIVLDGQRNLASTAEIMNRLTELQQEIANQSIKTLIPLEKTNTSETMSLKKTARPSAIKTSTSPKTGAPTLEDIQNVKLKKTPSPEAKTKKQSPMQKELEEKIKSRELSPSSSGATFQQSSMGSPDEKKGKTTLTGKTLGEIKAEFISKIKTPVSLGNYEIRIEKNKTIIKDLTTNSDIQKPPAQLLHTLYNEYKIAGNGIKSKKKSLPKRNAKGRFVS